jgi:hypothetical protein
MGDLRFFRPTVKRLRVRRDKPNPNARKKPEPKRSEKNLDHENDLSTLGYGLKLGKRGKREFGLFAKRVFKNLDPITYFAGERVSSADAFERVSAAEAKQERHLLPQIIHIPDSDTAIIGFTRSCAEEGMNAGCFVNDPQNDPQRRYNAKFEKIKDSMVLVATKRIERNAEIYASYGPAAAAEPRDGWVRGSGAEGSSTYQDAGAPSPHTDSACTEHNVVPCQCQSFNQAY